MKKVNISSDCIGCGLCSLQSNYILENDEGFAKPVTWKFIEETDQQIIIEMINQCPVNAIDIVEGGRSVHRELKGVYELIEFLKKHRDEYCVEKISKYDVKIDGKKYYIPYPSSKLEYKYNYNSENNAHNAAKDEFTNLCSSTSATDVIVKKIFAEYKVITLKPYYTFDNELSVYKKYNYEIETLLKEILCEATMLLNYELMTDIAWTEFDYYPNKYNDAITSLVEFDNMSTVWCSKSKLVNNGYVREIDDYLCKMSIDCSTKLEGTDKKGNFQYSKSYCFSGFNLAAMKYVDDVRDSVIKEFGDFYENVASRINWALIEYESVVKRELDRKITQFEMACRQYEKQNKI